MLAQDIRDAWRSLANNPAFAGVAVTCIALGVGVNSAIFTILDGVLLKPFPFRDPDRIVVIDSTNARLGVDEGGVSYPDYKDLRDQSTTLADLALFSTRSVTIADGGAEPERYVGTTITWNLLDLLGAVPALGRSFGPDDDRPAAERVVLIAYDVWQNRYGGSRSIVGRGATVNGQPHTIVGVMPPGFAFPQQSRVWLPLAPYAETSPRDARVQQAFARLRPGVTLEQASADVAAIAGRLATAYPATSRDWSARAHPLADWMLPPDAYLMIASLMGAVTLVLLVACSNVANLMLARASIRHREISIRSALGAGRLRIMRQLLTEAVMIGVLSVPPSLVIALGALAFIDANIPPDSLPYFVRWEFDARAFAYTIGIAVATGVVFGCAPAFQATGTSLLESLREGGHGSAGERRAWLRNSLVVAQVALALVLLVASSLFVRSFLNLRGADVGFDPAPLVTMRFFMSGQPYEEADAQARRVADIVARVGGLPGVEAAFASNFVPLSGGGGVGAVIAEGKPVEDGEEPFINFVATTPALRRTLGLVLRRGRDFTAVEGETRAPVALINESMARRVWGDADALGRAFRLAERPDLTEFTVIGIIADFRHNQGDDDEVADPAAYVPYPHGPALNTGLTIRAPGNPAALTAAVRQQIRSSDPGLPVFQVFTMEELRQRGFWENWLFGMLFFLFGIVALTLASLGVYGVLSYSVSQRTQEIGVRVALGAGRREVMRLVLRQGIVLAGIGIILGIAGARMITPLVRTLLYNVTPTDFVSFVGVALFLIVVALFASYVPARRATRVEAIVAIRNE